MESRILHLVCKYSYRYAQARKIRFSGGREVVVKLFDACCAFKNVGAPVSSVPASAPDFAMSENYLGFLLKAGNHYDSKYY
jgi:hypothetical protein